MADYASIGEAVGRGLGWLAESFLSAYNDNRRDATIATLEDSLVAGWLTVEAWSPSLSRLYLPDICPTAPSHTKKPGRTYVSEG